MAVTKTSTTLQSGFTQANLADEIKAAFIAFGFTLVEDYTATDRLLVFSYAFDATKTFGTIYLRVRLTAALAVNQSIGTAWNTTTKAIANESTASTAVGFIATSPLEIISYSRGSELKFLQLSQGTTTTTFLGTIRPENKPSWWNENTYPYCFIPNCNSNPNYFSTLYSSSLNPYSNNQCNLLFSGALSTANSVTGKRDVVAGLLLLSNSNQGIAGKTSTDIALAAASGLAKLDTLQVSAAEEYTLLFGGNNGVALRHL